VVCPGYAVSRIFGNGRTTPEAVLADEATSTILEGVAKREGRIVHSETVEGDGHSTFLQTHGACPGAPSNPSIPGHRVLPGSASAT